MKKKPKKKMSSAKPTVPSVKLNRLGEAVLANMREKKFPVNRRRPLEWLMLASMELAEAAEEARKPFESALYYECTFDAIDEIMPDEFSKPCGELIEIADVVQILAAYCAQRGWDLDEAIKIKHTYNLGRPAKHGGKIY